MGSARGGLSPRSLGKTAFMGAARRILAMGARVSTTCTQGGGGRAGLNRRGGGLFPGESTARSSGSTPRSSGCRVRDLPRVASPLPGAAAPRLLHVRQDRRGVREVHEAVVVVRR